MTEKEDTTPENLFSGGLVVKDAGMDSNGSNRKCLKLLSGGILLLFLLMGGCEQGLPEASSPAGVLYREKCGLCHPAPLPQKYTFKVWKGIIPTMEERVKKTGLRAPLTEEEVEILLNYFKKHSKRIF
ncbi:MAG: hypothetical protein GQ522_01040 [Deltaproteobacteria bacterium]|nr:hypothetical protein [Deltaproteobacteria bacterium]